MDLEEVKMEEKETVEDVILSYFKQKRNKDLPFIDYSVYDIIIKNIISRKEDVLRICSYDDDLKDALNKQNLELKILMEKINQTCEENTDLFAKQNLYLNRKRYQLLADERIKLNDILIDVCYS